MIKLANNQKDLEKIYRLRYEVLRKPWGQSFESVKDNLDEVSFNAFAEINDECEACGRLDIIDEQTAQIRYMAVHPDYRGKQWGSSILVYLEGIAKQKGISKIFLHARENSTAFYLKNGYKIIAPSYLLFGVIQHYRMEKEIKSFSSQLF